MPSTGLRRRRGVCLAIASRCSASSRPPSSSSIVPSRSSLLPSISPPTPNPFSAYQLVASRYPCALLSSVLSFQCCAACTHMHLIVFALCWSRSCLQPFGMTSFQYVCMCNCLLRHFLSITLQHGTSNSTARPHHPKFDMHMFHI